MYEICALLQTKKAAKPRKPSAPRITVGKRVKVNGVEGTVQARDTVYADAWFVVLDNAPSDARLYSYSRDIITVV